MATYTKGSLKPTSSKGSECSSFKTETDILESTGLTNFKGKANIAGQTVLPT